MAVALGEVALPGVLVVIIIVEELVAVVALGILVVSVALIILVNKEITPPYAPPQPCVLSIITSIAASNYWLIVMCTLPTQFQ
jgi:hypothetical protein